MFSQPIEDVLSRAQNILLVGMGGGYDIFAGIPLYFDLKQCDKPKQITLANFTFTRDLASKRGRRVCKHCLEFRYVDYLAAEEPNAFAADLGFPRNYCPEFHLSKWFHEAHGIDQSVHALKEGGVSDLGKALEMLVQENGIDTLVLVEAGVDSLIRGDEEGLGTFAEDALMLLAARRQVSVRRKIIMCAGLSMEGGVSEYDFLENWTAIQEANGFLGCVALNKSTFAVRQYMDAISQCVPANTTINSQIVAALEGIFGPQCTKPLTERGVEPHQLYINPLMTLVWFFDLEAVADHRLFLGDLDNATSLQHMNELMDHCRQEAGVTTGDGWYLGRREMRRMFGFLD